jgi:hypothetical protein
MTDEYVDSKLKQLDLITKRLMRRTHKRVVGMITPYPISNATFGDKVEGVILRYMFPCEGVLSKGMIKVDKKTKKSITIDLKIFGDSGSSSKGFFVDKKTFSFDLNISISSGDCLEILLTNDSEESLTEVWISLLWTPTTKSIESKSFLIEELENDLSKEQEVITEQLSGDS